MKLLTEYQEAHYGDLGKMVDDLANAEKKFYLIPAPVAEAVDKVLDNFADALNNACDPCKSLDGLVTDERTGRTTCTNHPDCPVAIGWAAWDDYEEACRE